MEAIYSSGFLAWLHQNLLGSLLEYIFLASPPAESDSVQWNGMRNLLLISPLRGLKCSWSDGWCLGSTDLSLGWLALKESILSLGRALRWERGPRICWGMHREEKEGEPAEEEREGAFGGAVADAPPSCPGGLGQEEGWTLHGCRLTRGQGTDDAAESCTVRLQSGNPPCSHPSCYL